MISEGLISIILCNYNYARFIGKAIKSVLEQTHQSWELIIVDDGSKDDSVPVIEAFDDPRIIKVFKENGGQASAFNAGFEHVRGEIVCLLDSDDWWKPEKLEKVMAQHLALEGKYSIIQHNLSFWKEGTAQGLYKNVLPSGECFAEMKKSGNIDFFVPTTGLSFNRKALDAVMPMPETGFRICADAYLMRTAFVFDQVFSIPEALGFYRVHENETFNNSTFDAFEFFKTTLFPALNRFYHKQGINYELKPPVDSWRGRVRGMLAKSLIRRS